jgi:2-polyprenyl-3-methyl-5-hydroxy-6-metoxy-1,4-benzoquinol methylase
MTTSSNSGAPTTDAERRRWERLAADPYYAVLNQERFRGTVNGDRLREFFATGEDDIRLVFEEIHRHLEPEFAPNRCLDFGCGVGRLVIPLAQRSGEVIGIDIASRMLAEARRNCEKRGITNVKFQYPDVLGQPAAEQDLLDLVHSYFVLQHVHPVIGERVVGLLLDRLRPGGIGALHFIFARHASAMRQAVNRMRAAVTPVNMLVNLMQGRPANEPQMVMYTYDRARLDALFTTHHCRIVHERPISQGGYLAAMVFLRRVGDA